WLLHSYRYYPDRSPLSAAAQAPYHGVRAPRHATLPAGCRRDRRGLLHGDPRPARESGIREPLPRLPAVRVRCRQHRRVRSFDENGAPATSDEGERFGSHLPDWDPLTTDVRSGYRSSSCGGGSIGLPVRNALSSKAFTTAFPRL